MNAPAQRTDLDALLDLTACPADRLWRYPLARALVPLAMRVPVRPNHITVFHTLLGVTAGVVLSQGTTRAMVAAGLMFEARAILDCLDGVVARAKKMSSPFGRALDQAGDVIGFASMMLGGAVILARTHGVVIAALMVVLASAVGASGTAAWDLLHRRLSSLLRQGHDATGEERAALLRSFEAKPSAVLRVSLVVQGVQSLLLGASSIDDGARDASGESPLGRAIRDAAAHRDPELRALMTRVGFVGGDMMLFLFSLTLLVGVFTPLFPFVTLGGVAVWGYTVITVNRYLNGLAHGAHDHDEHAAHTR